MKLIYKLVYNYVLVVYLIQWPLQVESNTVPKLIYIESYISTSNCQRYIEAYKVNQRKTEVQVMRPALSDPVTLLFNLVKYIQKPLCKGKSCLYLLGPLDLSWPMPSFNVVRSGHWAIPVEDILELFREPKQVREGWFRFHPWFWAQLDVCCIT